MKDKKFHDLVMKKRIKSGITGNSKFGNKLQKIFDDLMNI